MGPSRVGFILSIGMLLSTSALAQTSIEINNADFESVDGLSPTGWSFGGPGRSLHSDSTGAFSGNRAARVDATGPGNEQGFAGLSQGQSAIPFRGKRLRFRAAVRVADITGDGGGALWFRIDQAPGPDGRPRIDAFDNMQQRKITSNEWAHYDVVLDVSENAVSMVFGLLALGQCQVWIDDASLSIVDESVEITSPRRAAGAAARPEPPQLTPLQRAMRDADQAPQQPFFVWWLWLAGLGITLMTISQFPPRSHGDAAGLHKFCLRFAVVYWALYVLPRPIGGLIPRVGYDFEAWYKRGEDFIVRYAAGTVLNIQGELVGPNGSGDTTYSYIRVLICLAFAVVVAAVWSLIDRRKTDYRHANDLLRSGLRYFLAFTMIGYGLAKFGAARQFPEPGLTQLNKTWGDSSPMNLIWTMMGTSKAYTAFSGCAEVLGGLLLVWRRTTTLGAMVAFGVMLNVMMLNFCYDIPVKLFSAHLVFMAIFLLLPESGRLSNVLFFNRPTESREQRPGYAPGKLIWGQRVLKAFAIVMLVGFPIFQKVRAEQKLSAAAREDLPAFFGWYEVVRFERGGDEPVANDGDWRTVSFERLPYGRGGERKPTDWIMIGLEKSMTGTPITLEGNSGITTNGSMFIPRQMTLNETPDGIEIEGDLGGSTIRVIAKRRDRDAYRLTGRGFRWINEVPFNR